MVINGTENLSYRKVFKLMVLVLICVGAVGSNPVTDTLKFLKILSKRAVVVQWCKHPPNACPVQSVSSGSHL